MASFGRFVKTEREKRGWSQTELGALIKVNMPLVCRIENDKKQLAFDKLPLLADAFKMDYNTVKEKYVADKLAKDVLKYECSDEVLKAAESEVKYLRANNAKQSKMQF